MGGEQRGNPYAAPHRAEGGEQPGDDDAASELSYFPEGERHGSSFVGFGAILLPMLGGAAVALLFGSAPVTLLVAGLVIGWIYWKQRQLRVVPRAKLRVEDDVLHLSGPAFLPRRSLQLSELLDVYLDTKTIQRLQRNMGPTPNLRVFDATVSDEMDTARIALELENETLFLTEQRVSHTDANEWFSKIRRFLRKHGWVPDDERAA